ncbi:MAG: hypothetical protein GX614_06395 [Sandaracinaceae bacterium]|nr:hypothetical protein [Sandaracinaceae bacterium]
MDASFKLCSICRKPIGFGEIWWSCSVSTCNRGKTALYFCSVDCVDAHAPTLRHRTYYAEEQRAPTREAFLKAREEEAERESAREQARRDKNAESRRRIVQLHTSSNQEAEREILVIASRLKSYIRERSGMNTSDGILEKLSDHLRALADIGMESAASEGRKTVLARDIPDL